MFTVLLFAAIGLALGLLIWHSSRDDWSALVGCPIIAAVLGAFCAWALGGFSPQVLTVWQRSELVSMRPSEGVQGVFLFGTGAVGTEMSYRCMLKNADGSYSPHSATATTENTTIVEDTTLKDTGVLTIRTLVADPKWALGSWSFPWSSLGDYYEYRVPRGTVRSNFEVN